MIGVCTWSIDRADPTAAIPRVRQEFGLSIAHVGYFDEATLHAADPAKIKTTAGQHNVQLEAMFVGFEGIDYSSIARIAETSGFAPDDAVEQRLDMVRRAGEITSAIGCTELGVHIGTVPTDATSPARARLLERTQRAAGILREQGVNLMIETGAEPAATLAEFIEELACENVCVCFDPGNLVTYGTDDPVKAVSTLKQFIRLAHMKDAIAPDQPGEKLGQPARLGAGQANIPRVLSKLRVAGYSGPLLIESNTRLFGVESITAAADYLRSMTA